jgi:hypothetical protein
MARGIQSPAVCALAPSLILVLERLCLGDMMVDGVGPQAGVAATLSMEAVQSGAHGGGINAGVGRADQLI